MVNAPPEEKANRPWFRASPEEIAQVCTGLQRTSIKRVDFMEGKGPTVARYHTQTLLGDQQFFLQARSGREANALKVCLCSNGVAWRRHEA
jgi:hypothetical protein